MQKVCLLILCGLATTVGHAADSGVVAVRTYGVSDGLPSGTVRQIRVDSRGFLWFCGSGRLARFDGREFKSYGASDGLMGASILDIVEDVAHSTYWVGTSDGLFRLDTRRQASPGTLFEKIPLPLDDAAPRLLLDRRGRLWVGMSEGLALIDQPDHPQAQLVIPARGSSEAISTVFALVEDLDGAIWAGTHWSGLFRVAADASTVKNYPKSVHGLSFIRDLVLGPDQRIWCTFLGGVARFHSSAERYDTPVERTIEPRDGLPSIDTGRFCNTPTGELLVSSSGGVTRLRQDPGGNWQAEVAWSMRRGLPSDTVRPMAFDPAGNLWLGTIARGAMRLDPQGFRRFTQVESDGANLVGLIHDARGEVRALADLAHRGYRLYSLTDNHSRYATLTLPSDIYYLGWGKHRIAQDRSGHYWVGTGQGLLEFAADLSASSMSRTKPPLRRFDSVHGFPGDDVYWVASDSRGAIWASVAVKGPELSTLVRLEPGATKFTTIPTIIGIPPHDLATSLAEDRLHRVWVCFGTGAIVRFDGDKAPTRIDLGVPLLEVGDHQLYFDAEGRLWIASGRAGVRVCNEPTAATVRLNEVPAALAGQSVYCVVGDRDNRLYFGTDSGVVRLGQTTQPMREFTQADGLPGGAIYRCERDSNGQLWFGDQHGVARLDPAKDPPASTPTASFSELRIDGTRWSVPPLGADRLGPVRLSPGSHQIALEFFAINHTSGERIRYQHRLDTNATWSEPSEARSLEFPALTTGHHRLSVRAVSERGDPAPAAVLELVIPPAVWQRGWFLAIGLALTCAAAYLAYRLRLGQLLAAERMRTRIATDLHDAVGADLSRISLMADAAQRDLEEQPSRARSTLVDVAQSARDAVREMSDIVWALKPKGDDLAQVVTRLHEYANDVARPAGLSFVVDSPLDLDEVRLKADACRELYLLLKEAIANAARHSGAHSLNLSLRIEDRRLSAEMRDDGRGFVPGQTAPTLGGHGLSHMQARADRLGATLTIESAVGHGTTIRVRLPRA